MRHSFLHYLSSNIPDLLRTQQLEKRCSEIKCTYSTNCTKIRLEINRCQPRHFTTIAQFQTMNLRRSYIYSLKNVLYYVFSNVLLSWASCTGQYDMTFLLSGCGPTSPLTKCHPVQSNSLIWVPRGILVIPVYILDWISTYFNKIQPIGVFLSKI